MPLHERWSEYTKDEINEIKKNVCTKHKCPYLGRISTFSMNKQYSNMCCNYIEFAGHSRGCFPEDCTHYEDKNAPKRRRSITI